MAQQGIITCYINRDEYTEEYLDQLVASVKEANSDTIAKVKDQGYSVMFVITTNEATRVEKMDFDKPFPFFPPERRSPEELEAEAARLKNKREERLKSKIERT